MTEDTESAASTGRGDRRGGDRRSGDRRRTDRRAPLPPWRRPWALVAYGVVGALVVILLFNVLGDDEDSPAERADGDVITAGPTQNVERPDPSVATAPPLVAGTIAEYEQLIAEGDAAVGRRVRVELFCDAIESVALRDVERIKAAVDALASEGSVAAAECKWGLGDDVNREDLLVLVPPELAAEFASAPTVQQGFVDRRRIPAEVEWVGRSEALALRTVAVLRDITNP